MSATAARGSIEPLASMATLTKASEAWRHGRLFEEGIQRLEEHRRDLAVVPREQYALLADVRGLKLVFAVGFNPRMKGDRSPEDLGQPFGGDPLDGR